MGDGRMKVDEKTIERLSVSLQQAGLDFDAKKITQQLTRTEAGIVIMSVNSARSANAKRKLTKNIQRLLDRGSVKDLGRDRETTGYEGTERGNKGNEGIPGGVQTGLVREGRGDKEDLIRLDLIKNREYVRASIDKTQIIKDNPYLESKGILSTTINNPRFAGMIRQDDQKNIIFPHRDYDGISGAEINSQKFTGFMKGGTKAVWHSKTTPEDRRLVITESGVDALSYHQIKGDLYTRYLSVGGTMSLHQEEIVKAAINKMPAGSEIIAGFGKDLQGERFFERIKILAPHVNIRREVPAIGKDWNEQLQEMSMNRTPAKGPVRELLR